VPWPGASGRAMQSLHFEVAAFDPAIGAGTAGILVTIVLIATLLPSHRASRVDPLQALREE